MANLLKWFMNLFRTGVRVAPDGKGYRVNGDWVASQKEVRQRLEELGLTESEIIGRLRDLNTQKYGDPQR